ncbi:MAG: TolC family protein [Paludibacter sp.]|nr:TolC family protein [Paludibacter sp.]
MKSKILIITILSLFATLTLQAQKQWTLQECIDTALANNRNIKQREIVRQQNEIKYCQAKLDLLPNISASASQGWRFGLSDMSDGSIQQGTNSASTSFGLSSGLTIFDGMRMKYNIDARSLELKTAEAELEKIRQDMIMSVATAFLQTLLNKELVSNAHEQLKLTDSNILQKTSLVENGKLAHGDLLELQAQQSREEMTLIEAQNTLTYSLLELAQILELTDFSRMEVVVPEDLTENELALLDAETIYAQAVQHRPEVQSAEYQLQNSETSVNIARSAYFPRIELSAGVSQNLFNYKKENPLGSNVGFTLSVPIFDKLSTANQVKQAKLGVASSRLTLENTKLELRKTIQQIYANALSAKARWTAAIKAEKASSEAFRYANQKYDNDRASVYELYQAKSNLVRAQSELTQAKYEYIFRLKILELYAQ